LPDESKETPLRKAIDVTAGEKENKENLTSKKTKTKRGANGCKQTKWMKNEVP
jgi:hypothetical protein